MFRNASYQKLVSTNSQLYIGLRTIRTLENGFLHQRAGINAGNTVINNQVYPHPALGEYVEYILSPWGGIPKAIGSGNQFQVKDLQLILPEEPVSVGSTWTVTLPPTAAFPIAAECEYEVTSIIGALVIIRSRIEVQKDNVIGRLSFAMKGSSQIIFNSEEGLLLRNESTQYLEVGHKGDKDRSTRLNINSILELQF
jgi:hypothetical protein